MSPETPSERVPPGSVLTEPVEVEPAAETRVVELSFPLLEAEELNDALHRGEEFRRRTLVGPGMLSAVEASERLGSAAELNRRRAAGSILALEAPAIGVAADSARYPDWQFEPAVLPFLEPLFDTLPYLDAWGRYLFLVQPEPLLGLAPLDALRAGRADEVTHVARLLAAELTGA